MSSPTDQAENARLYVVDVAQAIRRLPPVPCLLPYFFTSNQERLAAVRGRMAAIDAELAELARAERAAASELIAAAGLSAKEPPNDGGLFALLERKEAS